MAVCIGFMFGRFGGVAGTNFSAYLIGSRCESAFYVPGFALFGNLIYCL